jgi:hypothetical protein
MAATVLFKSNSMKLINIVQKKEKKNELHNPGLADHRFRWMPSTHSGPCRPPVLTHGVQFFREAGIGGRLASESVDGMLRNPEEHV